MDSTSPAATEVHAFRRPDGHVYLTATRDRAAGWIHAQWSGIQTLDTIRTWLDSVP